MTKSPMKLIEVKRQTVWGRHPNLNNIIVSIDGGIQRLAGDYIINQHTKYKDGRHIYTPGRDKKGYLTMCIRSNAYSAHRLVADTFLPKVKYKYMVLHKNDVKHDNRLENLYRGDAYDNMQDAIRNGGVNKESIRKTSEAKHKKIRVQKGRIVHSFISIKECIAFLDCNAPRISKALKFNRLIDGWKVSLFKEDKNADQID